MKQLKQYILNETKKILNEELGISKEVQEATTNVLSFINEKFLSDRKLYKEYLWEFGNPESKVYGVEQMCDYPLFDNFVIKLIVRSCIFDDKEKMNEAYATLNNIEQYHFEPARKVIVLCFPAYRPNFNYGKDIIQIGLKNTRIRGTLAHEIKHAFQFFKKTQKYNTPNLLHHKDSNIYHKALKWADSKDKYMAPIGYYVYYCTGPEVTANMESLFTSIKQNCNNIDEAKDFIKKSRLSYNFYGLMKLIDDINKNNIPDNVFIMFKEYFNRDKEWLIKHFNKGVKSLKRCIKRAAALSQKYFNNTQPTE